MIATDGLLLVAQPVIMEVLASACNDQRELDLRRLLLRFTLQRFEQPRTSAARWHSTTLPRRRLYSALHGRGRRVAARAALLAQNVNLRAWGGSLASSRPPVADDLNGILRFDDRAGWERSRTAA